MKIKWNFWGSHEISELLFFETQVEFFKTSSVIKQTLKMASFYQHDLHPKVCFTIFLLKTLCLSRNCPFLKVMTPSNVKHLSSSLFLQQFIHYKKTGEISVNSGVYMVAVKKTCVEIDIPETEIRNFDKKNRSLSCCGRLTLTWRNDKISGEMSESCFTGIL